jgi:predicted HTH domain antitoxin
MNITIPDDVFRPRCPSEAELRVELAVALLAQYWLAPAEAARLAGMREAELLGVLTARRISTRYNAEAVRRATAEMRGMIW